MRNSSGLVQQANVIGLTGNSMEGSSIFKRKTSFMLELNTKAGLAYSRLQETILTIEDLKEQGSFANVKNQGRTNLIFYQDSARCTET